MRAGDGAAPGEEIQRMVSLSGLAWLRVDTNHINFFRQGHPLSQSAAVIDRQLSGVYSFQLMLEGPPDSLNTPDAPSNLPKSMRSECSRNPNSSAESSRTT